MNKQLANCITDRILNEQYSMYGYGGGSNPASTHMSTKDIQQVVAKDSVSNIWNNYKHEIVQVAALAALMTGVGTPLYIALQALDATLYVAEGDREGAMLTVGFALLPGAGKLGQTAAIRVLGKKGMAKLGAKVARAKATKRLILSKTEKAALKAISANKEEAARIIRSGAKKLATSKVGKATGLVAKGVKGTTKFAAKTALGYGAVKAVVDPLYKYTGMEDKDIEDQVGADDILSGLK